MDELESAVAETKPPKRTWPRRVALALAALIALCVVTVMVAGFWLRGRVSASLPHLDGEVVVAGLESSVVITRDSLGIPTIRGGSRADVAFATGFIHAQDRFFQMDLMRRQAAGELAAIFGEGALGWDRFIRVHRLRTVAEKMWAGASGVERKLLEAYSAGVNAGLTALDERPFEYLVLRQQAEPWHPVDSILVILAMFIELHDEDGSRESSLGVLHDVMPAPLYALLAAQGTEWDAPIVGEALLTPPVPGAEVFDLRTPGGAQSSPADSGPEGESGGELDTANGSNNWAVAASLSRSGRAILANDMHLGIGVPNTWYRAMLRWQDSTAPDGARWICGVTLSGVPSVVVGSNGSVAWGFTNSYGDWVDLVELELVPGTDDTYVTAEGPLKIERITEVIEVHGGAAVELEVEQTIWGPVIDRDHEGRPRAIRWTAHDPRAVNFHMLEMESATDIDSAMEIANRMGIPPQNFVCADASGRVGWTIIGQIPRRVGFDGRLPAEWSSGEVGWQGWLEPDEFPRVVDPPSGRLWTANARVVGGEMLAVVGDGGYALGARARQIRDNLMASGAFDEMAMLEIQLDDRALFLTRWRDLLLETLTDDAIAADPRRAELRQAVDQWGGRAAIDSVGYRMVRAFRAFLSEQVLDAVTAQARAADDRFRHRDLGQTEGAVWRLVSERPLHLLDPRFSSWEEQLLAAVDTTLDTFLEDGSQLADHTWGERNTARIQHPLSRAIPQLATWLDMPAEPLPGGTHMPRVQGPDFGASERMVVSPGHEESGLFHTPCGQSGHPMSPFYRAGHDAWVQGEPSPFLPGKALHELTLTPAGGDAH